YPIDGTGDNGVTINTLGTPATGGLGPPPPVGAPGAPVRSNYNRWRPNASVTTGLVGFEGVSGGSLDVRDTFDPRMLDQSIISPTTNYHLFLQGSYDLQRWGDSQLYFEFLGSNRISSQALYRQLTVDYPRFPGACTPNVSSDNPLLPLNIGCFSANFLAAGGSTITSGLPTAVRAFIGFGNTRFAQDEWYYKTVGGIRGNFALPGWKYDVGVWYARSDTSYGQQTFLTDKLSETLAVVPAPAGFDSTLVRPGAQPGVNLTCAINISNPAARCIPAPVLTADVIGGTLPADWVHY